jgi:hypothetical protein
MLGSIPTAGQVVVWREWRFEVIDMDGPGRAGARSRWPSAYREAGNRISNSVSPGSLVTLMHPP